MGAMIGLAVGYVLGTKAGQKGYDELQDAWETISSSEEVRDMLIGGLAMARDLVRHGRTLLAERLAVPAGTDLRSVA
jgi:hypothetical protein